MLSFAENFKFLHKIKPVSYLFIYLSVVGGLQVRDQHFHSSIKSALLKVELNNKNNRGHIIRDSDIEVGFKK